MPLPLRRDRLAPTIRDLVAAILRDLLLVERFGLITVMDVQVAKGGDSARVRVSALKNSHTLEKELKTKILRIQGELNRSLPRAPKLIFDVNAYHGTIEG